MFIPTNYLKLLSIAFDCTGLTKGTARNDKLGFKEHSSLKRHQVAYQHTLKLVVESLAQSHPEGLFNYASSFQRFLNELHAPPFETDISESEGNNVYWKYLYAPMIAVLLHRFSGSEYEGNAIHFLCKLLKSKYNGDNEPSNPCPSESSEKARWAKTVIESNNGLITRNFTARINNLRGTSIRSITTIKSDILLLEEDLKTLKIKDKDIQKHLVKVQSAYIAAMIIRRLEDNGSLANLKLITEYLIKIEKNGYGSDRLLLLHNDVCDLLLLGDYLYNLWQTEKGINLITQIEKYLLPKIAAYHPAIQDKVMGVHGDDVWPDFDKLNKELNAYYNVYQVTNMWGYEQTLLEKTLLNYYKMYYYTETKEFDKAVSHCKDVESVFGKVHLGNFLAATLVHKIILHWLISGTMKHNQFSSEITNIVLHIQEEPGFQIAMNPIFSKYQDTLSDEEKMMINIFRIFNQKHSKVAANPLKPISDAMGLAVILCDGSEKSVQELLPTFKKQVDSKYKRTLSVLPFCRLTLSQCIDMIPELFALFGLPVNYECLYKFQSNIKCKQLIKELDVRLQRDN